MRCWTPRATNSCSTSSELPLADGRRPRADARGDRRRQRRRAVPRHSAGSAAGPGARPRARALGARARRASRGARGAERRRAPRGVVPRRRHLRPLRACGRGPHPPARGVPHRVHAVSAGAQPGRAAGDLRVPDRDLRADGHGRLERVRLRRHDGRRRRLLHGEARHGPRADRRHRGHEPAGAPGDEDVRAGLRPRGRRGAARRAA